jgi:hypothetical protein
LGLEQDILRALVAEGRSEAMVNAMKIAGPGESYERVFESIMKMENQNLVKLVYCQHPAIINVQATLVGLDAATSGKS